jgi:dipeptidyl aminopeptidase/acylaminoacyl peptidase
MRTLLLAVVIALASPSFASDAPTHPFSVDDLLALEDIGQVWTPAGTGLVVFEAMRPFGELSPLNGLTLRAQARTRILVAPLDGSQAPRELFPQDENTGYSLGTRAPNGRAITILVAKEGALSTGVYDFDARKFTPLGVTPRFDLDHFLSIWLSKSELLIATPPPGQQSPAAIAEGGWAQEMLKQWPIDWKGKVAVVSELRSGAPYAEHPAVRGGTLVKVNVASGKRIEISTGDFREAHVSPRGDRVAAVRDRGPVLPPPEKAMNGYEPLRYSELVIFGTQGGGVPPLYPCEGCTVMDGTVSWSPDGKRLMFFAKLHDDDLWAQAQYFEYDIGTQSRRPILPEELMSPLRDAAASGGGFFASVPAPEWIGDAQIVFARPAHAADQEASRTDWYLLRRGQSPRNLTSSFKQVPQLLASTRDGLVVASESAVWRVTLSGTVRRVTPPGMSGVNVLPAELAPHERLLAHASGDTSELLALDTDRARVQPLHLQYTEEELVAQNVIAASSAEHYALLKRASNDGCALLVLHADGSRKTLYNFNDHLRAVQRATPVRIEYRNADGKNRSAWVLLPPGRGANEHLPAVTYVYLRQRTPEHFRDKPEQLWTRSSHSMQLMAARGYAVVFPEIEGPRFNVRQDIMPRLPKDVLPALDRAAELGMIDGQRLAVYGVSYGSFATAALLVQTDRFKAAITEANGQFNFSSTHGVLSKFELDQPTPMSAYAESFFRAPPWQDPDIYIRNSPLFHADKITTPWLLIQGGLDQIGPTPPQEAEAMFSALWRQRKDAALLRYWGQGHGTFGAADIRDKWTRIYAWLERYLQAH